MSDENHSWVDSLPFEIPFGLPTTFKSDEDWLDDYRRGIRKALKKTEAQEEEENEVDLMFADVDIVDESAPPPASFSYDGLAERFTPVCTPSRNRKDLLDCEEGEWDSEWDEDEVTPI